MVAAFETAKSGGGMASMGVMRHDLVMESIFLGIILSSRAGQSRVD